jgi:hypothetical protein
MIHAAGTTKSTTLRSMNGHVEPTHGCAQNLWARLSSAASQLFLRLTEPARPNLLTGTLADLPRRSSLSAWQQKRLH